jgi:hypothetical protein
VPPEQLFQLKIIYWGPAEAGKVTALLAVADILYHLRPPMAK